MTVASRALGNTPPLLSLSLSVSCVGSFVLRLRFLPPFHDSSILWDFSPHKHLEFYYEGKILHLSYRLWNTKYSLDFYQLL